MTPSAKRHGASVATSPAQVLHSGGSQTTVQRILRKAHNDLCRAEFTPFLRVATEDDASEGANRFAGVDDFPVHEDAL